MNTVLIRPESFEVVERVEATVTDPSAGMVHVGYRDRGTTKRWVLRWHNASVRCLAFYRYWLSGAFAGELGAWFLWRPPRESDPVVARRVSAIRGIQVRTPRAVSFEVELEAHVTGG